jgi:hypothetical protein
MKTKIDGCFYRPNQTITENNVLKVEMLFDNQNLTGDQTGGTSPYSSINNHPDGSVQGKDLYFVFLCYGSYEGDPDWEYMVDVVPDRLIDTRDLYAVAINYGKHGTYITELSEVTITFNTGEEKTPDNDGFVSIPQNATSFTVKRYGNPIGAMITFW